MKFFLVVVFNGMLSCHLGLDYCNFREVSRNLVNVISNVSCHAGVWISFIRIRIGSDRPTGVSLIRLTSALLSMTLS